MGNFILPSRFMRAGIFLRQQNLDFWGVGGCLCAPIKYPLWQRGQTAANDLNVSAR